MNRGTAQQEFGGVWTDQKLRLLSKYLEAYMVIFRTRPFLSPVYIDAFAGTGRRPVKTDDVSKEDSLATKGSARIALEVAEPSFKKFVFVEKSPEKCSELLSLKDEYPEKADRIEVIQGESSEFLKSWASSVDTKTTRAVIFLDPFGMQVEWSLLEVLANTQIVDLWILVPLGIGANRLLTRHDLPSDDWSEKLTNFFGNEDWKERFYRSRIQPDLFGESSALEKHGNHDALCDYFIERLKAIFPGVADNPVTQRNSNNSPMFLLCFATANPNPNTIAAAKRIAQHLLKVG